MNAKKRGFGAMDPERQRAIARKGGIAAHERGTAHQFTPEEGREAGKKGGKRVVEIHGKEHMADIGRAGGEGKSAKMKEET